MQRSNNHTLFMLAAVALSAGFCASAHANLKGTNTTLWSWNETLNKLEYANSNVKLTKDGKWHPFWASLNFDTDPTNVNFLEDGTTLRTDINGDPIACSTVDTDGNNQTYQTLNRSPVTRWAGTLQLSVDTRKLAGDPINGFQATRCWQLTVCDRQGTGSDPVTGLGRGTFKTGDDLGIQPRFRRVIADITNNETAVCRTADNVEAGAAVPIESNGFISLVSKDVPSATCGGNCDEALDTILFVNLDRDCDGTADLGATPGDPTVIGDGTNLSGLIPRKVDAGDPDVCFYAEAQKPDPFSNPQWGTGNIQARVTAPAGGSGDKTVNHKFFANPTLADSGDLPAEYPTAFHVTNAFSDNPYIGAQPDTETLVYSSPAADQDDNTGSSDEIGGIVMPVDSTTDGDGDGNIYTGQVTATNPSSRRAQLCGWFDMNQDGVLNNFANPSSTGSDPGPTSVSGERTCVEVPAGATAQTFDLAWTLTPESQGVTGNVFFRFRITNDADAFLAGELSPENGYSTGEVSDLLQPLSGTLPVSIAAFESSVTAEGLVLEWSTVSETRNAGYVIWGNTGERFESLTAEPIPSEEGDALAVRDYRVVIPGVGHGEISELAVTAIDYNGKEEVYGLFTVGESYGEKVESSTGVDWRGIRTEAASRISRHAQAASRSLTDVRAVDVGVFAAGMQSVSWQMLNDAGLDLTGVSPDAIAVTRNGEPVARKMISGTAGGFQPGDAIHFWGEKPAGRDALYVDRYRYRISVDPANAVAAVEPRAEAPGNGPAFYTRRQFQDADEGYHLASPLDDPWFAARLRADRNNTYTTTFTIGDDLVAGQPGRVEVRVGGLTNFPAEPDHHVRVSVNGVDVGELMFEGQGVHLLDYAIPAGLLLPGVNEVTVSAPGGTAAAFDISLVDTVALEYAAALELQDDGLLIPDVTGKQTFTINGLGTNAQVYAWNGHDLQSMTPKSTVAFANSDVLFRADFEPGEQVPRVLTFNTLNGTADYWVSTTDQINTPELLGGVGENRVFDGRDVPNFLVIGHPAFLPLSVDEPHPLNDFIALKQAEGWNVGVYNITELQAQYTGGMPLPEAVNRFLADADGRFAYDHVLLVGSDSYDYTDNLGLGSISFIPTHYAATRFIKHTPSDALLADLDGDGLSDKALGRWPVRNHGDLEAIVAKTAAWRTIANPESTVWVTDAEDGRSGSFRAQAERMLDALGEGGWSSGNFDRVFWDDITPVSGQSIAQTARAELFDRLEQGRAMTGFVGHGSPTMWTFQGLLRPSDLDDLFNEGNPTLISTLTCYTSYFVSPNGDSVAHRWMNGYREDALGNRIPGVANGSVAIHGAATLSDYGMNETMMRDVIDGQMQLGLTLGEAIQAARVQARTLQMHDVVTNWTLLGDPTLRFVR